MGAALRTAEPVEGRRGRVRRHRCHDGTGRRRAERRRHPGDRPLPRHRFGRPAPGGSARGAGAHVRRARAVRRDMGWASVRPFERLYQQQAGRRRAGHPLRLLPGRDAGGSGDLGARAGGPLRRRPAWSRRKTGRPEPERPGPPP